MTCEKIRNELVAYRDGELSERDHARVAQHLGTCSTCQQADAQFARVGQLCSTMERITPSADFAANFRLRLAHEDQQPQESGFARWWREWLSGWQMTPMLVGAASLLIFFGYWFVERPGAPSAPQPTAAPVQVAADAALPEPIIERPALFADYKMLVDLDKFAHFEDIVATEESVAAPKQAAPARVVAQQEAPTEDLPPELLRDPNFFLDYPMLRQMKKLQNMEAVLAVPTEGDPQQRG